MNAEISGDEIIYKNYVHMGIAVGGSNGLVVSGGPQRRPEGLLRRSRNPSAISANARATAR